MTPRKLGVLKAATRRPLALRFASLADPTSGLSEKAPAALNGLLSSVSITAEQYEQLHRGQLSASLHEPTKEFALTRVGGEGLMEGQREYRFVDG